MLTKIQTLCIGLIGFFWWIFLFVLQRTFFSVEAECHMNYVGRCGMISNVIAYTVAYIAPLIAMLIFSLLTYWMRDNVYQAWFKFARWAIPLSMLLIFLAPEYSHDWMYPIEKGTVAFFSSVIFSILSIIIIGTKYLAARRGKIR